MVQAVYVNYVAVLGAAVFGMVLGALWYSILFGKLWMKLSGITSKQIAAVKKNGMKMSYLLAFVGNLVMAYVLAHFIAYVDAVTAWEGIVAGFWLWLGFIATVTLGGVLWEGKSVKLYLLNNAYHLVSLAVMGAILAVWI